MVILKWNKVWKKAFFGSLNRKKIRAVSASHRYQNLKIIKFRVGFFRKVVDMDVIF